MELLDPFEAAEELLQCITERLRVSGSGRPKHRFIVADQTVDLDDFCCEGAVWVRIDQIYWSSTFPQPTTGDHRCANLILAAVFEAGVADCVSQPSTSGITPEFPTPAQVTKEARKLTDQMRALLCGINDCTTMWQAAPDKRMVWLQPIQPGTAEGGCMWATGQLTLELGSCIPC